MSRITSRETLMKLVYGLSFSDQVNLDNFHEVLDDENIDEFDIEYVTKALDEIKENYSYYVSVIEKNLVNFKLDRISKTDLAILVVAIYELNKKVDSEKIVINEAVNLSKKYSQENSYKFVNGILGKIFREQNELQ